MTDSNVNTLVRHGRTVLLPVLLCLGLTLTGCGSGAPSTSGGSSGTALAVGSDLTYPPYASLDGTTPVGFDPEMVAALGKAMDRPMQIKDTRFEQLIPNLDSGHIDIIASALYVTAERATQVDYIPYFSTGNSIVVQASAHPIKDATGLCGKKVGVIKGGDIVQRLRGEASKACSATGQAAVDVHEFATDPEATQALISGQVDAQVTDAGVASTLGKETSGKVRITSHDLLYPIPVGLAVKKGNTKLRDQLKTALKSLVASGEYGKLLKKYNLEPVDESQVKSILGKN